MFGFVGNSFNLVLISLWERHYVNLLTKITVEGYKNEFRLRIIYKENLEA